ncbi:ETX/MTX2 family pore-forming toxin [Bacillus cereus group sp. IBL03679]|uniref:ETX/MTX2 family pore-forming toxin n=1 Tax=Bacillus cereus group sp. IBL03679 TaxID=3240095 RepID=UPI003D2F7245
MQQNHFSSTAETTKTESYTYTASAQNILVPANSSVEVIVNLNTAKLSGNVKLLSHVDGKIAYNAYNWNATNSTSFRGMLTTLARPYEIDNNVKVHPSNGAYLIGKGKYSAEYGTEFAVTVRPVEGPKGFSAKLGESTNEGYTYTVKPEVKKEK